MSNFKIRISSHAWTVNYQSCCDCETIVEKPISLHAEARIVLGVFPLHSGSLNMYSVAGRRQRDICIIQIMTVMHVAPTMAPTAVEMLALFTPPSRKPSCRSQ